MKVKCFRYKEITTRLNNEENYYIRLIGEKIFNDSLINHNIETVYDFVQFEKRNHRMRNLELPKNLDKFKDYYYIYLANSGEWVIKKEDLRKILKDLEGEI